MTAIMTNAVQHHFQWFAAVLISNLGGGTGFLLGLDGGQLAGKLKIDSLFPVRNLKRCINYQQRFGEHQISCG